MMISDSRHTLINKIQDSTNSSSINLNMNQTKSKILSTQALDPNMIPSNFDYNKLTNRH